MVRIPKITFIAALLVAILSASLAFGRTDEDVPVSCYLGSQDQYQEMGTIDVLNPSRNAVGLCNATYWDCNSQCWACWDDSEAGTVCKDGSGRQFSR
jgi:hypothetical protein